MSRGRQRTLFSVGRRFPYAMARVFSPMEALACFLFGPIRKLTHACALEAARRKIERRSVPVTLAVRRRGLAVQVQTSYWPLSDTANSTDFDARLRGSRGCREHAKGNVQPSHVPAASLCLPFLPCADLRSGTRLHGTVRYVQYSSASLRRCAAGLSPSRRCRMLLKHGGRKKDEACFRYAISRPSERERIFQ
jgi:hypothetical protein